MRRTWRIRDFYENELHKFTFYLRHEAVTGQYFCTLLVNTRFCATYPPPLERPPCSTE